MRLALISDIHGNRLALDAALADIERLGVGGGVCLGDVVQGGPQPAEVLERVQELGWPVILGNADDFVLEVPEDSLEEITERQLEVRDWTRSQLGEAQLALIRSFAPTVELELTGGARLLANPGSVGLAYDRHRPPADVKPVPIAEYGLVHANGGGVAVEFRRVPYDLGRLLAAAAAGGRPDADQYAAAWA